VCEGERYSERREIGTTPKRNRRILPFMKYIIYNNGNRNGPVFHLKRRASAAVLCQVRIVGILYYIIILVLLLFYHVPIYTFRSVNSEKRSFRFDCGLGRVRSIHFADFAIVIRIL